MWSDVENKRSKYMTEMRRKQHNQYFDLHRQWNYGSELSGLTFLPVLLQEELYDDIARILDSIECENEEIPGSLVKQIRDRYLNYRGDDVRFLMFRVLNRLGQWSDADVNQAKRYLIEGEEDILREMALYLENFFLKYIKQEEGRSHKEKYEYDSQENEDKKESQKIEPNMTSAQSICSAVISYQLKNTENRLFWLSIICMSTEYPFELFDELVKNPSVLFFAIEEGLQSEKEIELIRIVRIITKASGFPELRSQIVNMTNFSKIIEYILNGSIDIVIEGIEILAVLMSDDEEIIEKLVQNFGVLKILEKYLGHVMVAVQRKVLWALSNVIGSEQYKCITENKELVAKIMENASTENMQIRQEFIFCFLNLLERSSQDELQHLSQFHNSEELLCEVLSTLESPNVDAYLFTRTISACNTLVNVNPKSIIKLEQFSMKKILALLYENEKDVEKLKLIEYISDVLEKAYQQLPQS